MNVMSSEVLKNWGFVCVWKRGRGLDFKMGRGVVQLNHAHQ